MTNVLRDSAPEGPVNRAVNFYKVPAGTAPAKCKGPNCAATIYFITSTKTGRPLPINCDVEGGRRPSEATDASQLDLLAGAATVYDGKGVSHFTDCVDVERFSRGAR